MSAEELVREFRRRAWSVELAGDQSELVTITFERSDNADEMFQLAQELGYEEIRRDGVKAGPISVTFRRVPPNQNGEP